LPAVVVLPPQVENRLLSQAIMVHPRLTPGILLWAVDQARIKASRSAFGRKATPNRPIAWLELSSAGPVSSTTRFRLMRSVRWLAVIPFLALVVGPFFVNRATPIILDLPFLLAWIVAWILITSAIMAVIYATDPANRSDEP
jgi:hypothetical protein